MTSRPNLRNFLTYKLRESAYESVVRSSTTAFILNATFTLVDAHLTGKLYYSRDSTSYVWAFPYGHPQFDDLPTILVNPKVSLYATSEYLLIP